MTENASCGRTTYVHCKAGRGRSTTIVICYLVNLHSKTFIYEILWLLQTGAVLLQELFSQCYRLKVILGLFSFSEFIILYRSNTRT